MNPSPAFPQVKGAFSTWWLMKDSNLRSFRDGLTGHRQPWDDQRKRLSHINFHAHSHRQPTTAVCDRLEPAQIAAVNDAPAAVLSCVPGLGDGPGRGKRASCSEAMLHGTFMVRTA